MDIFYFNAHWMGWNAYLALLPLLFYWLFLKVKIRAVRAIFLVLWFLYLPNSIYVITDMEHLIAQWNLVPQEMLIFLIMQYVGFTVIGMWAYLVGFYPIEQLLQRLGRKTSGKNSDYLIMVTIHFIIGFAMVLGKVERVNSWEVFTNAERVYYSVLHVLQSPDLVLLSVLFGIFNTCFYLLFRNQVVAHIPWFKKKSHH